MSLPYTTLVADKSTTGSIKSWSNYSKVDAAGVVADAEAMIFTRLRVREMRASETMPVKVGASGIDLPDGFLDPISLRDVTNDCDLDIKGEDELEHLRSWTSGVLDSGDPAYFAIFDEQYQFECRTATAWTARALYYKLPDALSSSNPRNWLSDRYQHVLRMGCLAIAARFSDDEARFAREQRLLFNEIDEINIKDEQSRRGQV